MSFAYVAIAYGWGKPMAYVLPGDLKMALKMQFALQLTWIFSLSLTRLSIAASLLRFDTDRWWRWTLYFIMGLQCAISTTYVVIQLGQCTPISASWETVPNVKCWPMQPIINFGWAVSGTYWILTVPLAIYIIMDLTFSLMPIKLIRSLSRSTSEKLLIGFLMSLGLAATAVLCAKLTTFATFGGGDALQATMLPSVYAKLEEVVMIIACSLPCLKSPAERLLRQLGILKEHQLTRPSFVNTMQLPTVIDTDQRTGSNGSSRTGKDVIRIDSVAFKSGSAQSLPSTKQPTTGTEAV
ncbi:hypothetical protein N0V90_009191 [Kalmusia sp. IMI 367209]|nr:hypothetical protein N0V90_009191 [Kalmusia sp. IMI 367209]